MAKTENDAMPGTLKTQIPPPQPQGKRLWKKNKKVQVASILQMEAIECGAAALAMVLAYYGRYVPLEKLRVECGVSRDGSKANNMLKRLANMDWRPKATAKNTRLERISPADDHLLEFQSLCRFDRNEGQERLY